MADAYWMCSDGRIQPASLPPSAVKRPRTDNDVPGGPEMPAYYGRDGEPGMHHVIRDSDPIEASYERYLRGGQISSNAGGESARSASSGLVSYPINDPRAAVTAGSESVAAKNMSIGLGGGRPETLPPDASSTLFAKGLPPYGTRREMPQMAPMFRPFGMGGGRPAVHLPPDASSTLFVEGLPADCTRREVSHIFRPFVGYKEVRLVTKESRHAGGSPLVLCFVDFVTPAQAATAMDALQGYKFDDHDRNSVNLKLEFARHPGARSGGGHRGKH